MPADGPFSRLSPKAEPPPPFWFAAACLAIVAPTLLAFNVPPSPTFFNQAIAYLGWGCWALLLTSAAGSGLGPSPDRGLAALLAALALPALSALATPLWASLPWSLALSSALTLAATALVALVGASLTRRGLAVTAFHAFAVGLLLAGMVGAVIGLVQVFAPQWTDGQWIAAIGEGANARAAGNLRQPNHLSSLLLWTLVAVVWLVERDRLARRPAAALGVLMLAGVVLSASRTGVIGVLLLAAWGMLDRGLSRGVRRALGLAPVAYVLLWLAFAGIKHLSGQTFGGEGQLARQDFSSSRFAIWSNALALVARQPWLGVGWGEFNFAWTLTPFPQRPTAFFDHTHNLPLQLAVEMGVPLAVLVMALLVWALWRAFAAAHGTQGALRLTRRAAFMTVLLMGLHSQLEYPLWYAYFLLPTAFAWGLALGRAPGEARASDRAAAGPASLRPAVARTRPLWMASALLVAGGAAALYDYLRVTAIFSPLAGAAPLAERIADGRRSVLFSHHADYAAATDATQRAALALEPFRSATHYLLDARLMQAWAVALAASGDDARARYVAARLREFHNEGSKAFFAPCEAADAAEAEAEAPTVEDADPDTETDAPVEEREGDEEEDADPMPEGRQFQCEPEPEGLTFHDFR